MKRFLSLLLLSVPLLMAAPAPRAADSYRVDAIYLDRDQIVLRDQVFRLSTSTHVYRSNGSPGTLAELRKGMRVNIQTRYDTPSPLVLQIRILQ